MNSSITRRFVAYLIDWILITILLSGILYFMPKNNNIELMEKQNNISEQFINKDINYNQYMDEVGPLVYEIDKNNTIPNLINLTIIVLYFGVFQYYRKQTLGKKVMNIKVSSDNMSINKLIIRTCLIYGVFTSLVNICCTLFMTNINYTYVTVFTSFIQYLFILVTVVMIIFKKDKKGLHDIITNTEVVEANNE